MKNLSIRSVIYVAIFVLASQVALGQDPGAHAAKVQEVLTLAHKYRLSAAGEAASACRSVDRTSYVAAGECYRGNYAPPHFKL